MHLGRSPRSFGKIEVDREGRLAASPVRRISIMNPTRHGMRITAVIAGLLFCVLNRTEAASPPVDLDLAATEVSRSYVKAHPEVQEFVLHTVRTFGASGMWLNENAYATLKPEQREERIVYLTNLFNETEYGRHLCNALAEASALKDPRLVPGHQSWI